MAEDRKSCEDALKLLIISLRRHNTDIPVVVFYPAADQIFLDWTRTLNFKNLTVRTTPVPAAYAWNVKPQALLELLNEGNQEIIWIDSDILVTKDIFPAIKDLDNDVLVATEEALLGQNETNGLRARLWGFNVKRELPFPLNTGVMRVTSQHTNLLRRWKDILESQKYRNAQQRPLIQRPVHMIGDQDVLTALLTSEEFFDIPLKLLRRGADIIQYYEQYGFTLAERFTCMLRGMPTFIHQQGWKPWLAIPNEKLKGIRGKIEAAYQDLSPYTLSAIAMHPTENCPWTRPRSNLSSFLRRLGFGYPQLVGLPIAVVFDFERLCKLPRRVAKRIFSRFYPEAILIVRARRTAKEMRQNFRNTFLERQTRMKARIYGNSHPYVLSGPFSGMKYINEIVWGPIEPKWLGTYEQELHSVLQQILKTTYSSVIDVGSAEGYYAVGLAIKFPHVRVYSYDTDPWARSQQRRLARLNRVANLEIRGFCTGNELAKRVAARTLLICDIEGSEYDILDRNRTSALDECDILVEVHERGDDFTTESGADELIRRFANSHTITKIRVEPRSPSAVDDVLPAKLTTQEVVDSMDERRSPEQIWLWLRARKIN